MVMRVILVDDHPVVRAGLRSQLETLDQFHVVGEAGDSVEALWLAQEKKPELALVDIGLPGTDGIELTGQLQVQCPDVIVCIFSMYDDEESVCRSVRAGARGYVLKDSGSKQIAAAVAAIAAGGTFYTSNVVQATVRPNKHCALSPREHEVLNYLVEGRSNKEVANQLKLSVRTVETHREAIRRKLGAERIAHLIRQALRFGLIKM